MCCEMGDWGDAVSAGNQNPGSQAAARTDRNALRQRSLEDAGEVVSCRTPSAETVPADARHDDDETQHVSRHNNHNIVTCRTGISADTSSTSSSFVSPSSPGPLFYVSDSTFVFETSNQKGQGYVLVFLLLVFLVTLSFPPHDTRTGMTTILHSRPQNQLLTPPFRMQ